MGGFNRSVRVRAIIPHDGKFLFVQHKLGPAYFALAGGGLDDGETLEQGIERELIEELGVKPVIGKLLYVQQLFIGTDEESLEFFYLIENGADYTNIDLQATTHGAIELSKVEFIDPTKEFVQPDFLANLAEDMKSDIWPRVYVRTIDNL